MTTTMTYYAELYRHLRPYLRSDLVANGFPNPVAGTILNWFDPAKQEYLSHVDTWQKLLCRGVSTACIPFLIPDEMGIHSTAKMAYDEVKQIQQVAKLLYKFHGMPLKETDWSAVKERLSKPLPLRLKDYEIEGIRKCLSDIKPPDLNKVRGRFGPGATAEGFKAFEKWMREGYIPDVPPNLYRSNPRDPWTPKGVLEYRETKVAEVPKSIKCNRIVSSEPAMSMFAQLALNDDIVEQIHALFRGHVSLQDQDKHNELLMDRGMATLDLSDASDHISCELVRAVLPQLWPVLAKVRSEYSRFPDGTSVPLATFAPMGAGFCFSIMTTVILGIISYATRTYIGWKDMRWSVYGDDIIVPAWICQEVMDLLERAGLVINYAKSCYSGSYVESCGLELFDGHDVTPFYIRDPIESLSAETVEEILNISEFFPRTANEIYLLAQPVRGWRWNKDLQEGELLVRTTSVRAKLRYLDGAAGLNRWFSVGSKQDITVAERSKNRIRFSGKLDTPQGVEWTLSCPTDWGRSGVANEVWTKPAWRYRLASNYPNLMFMSGSHAILRQEDKQVSNKVSPARKSGKTQKQSTDH